MRAKYCFRIILIVLSSILLVGCQGTTKYQNEGNMRPLRWLFELKLSSGVSLTDSDQSSLLDLREQLSTLSERTALFRDPVIGQAFLNDPSSDTLNHALFLTVSKQKTLPFQWKFSQQRNEDWRFSHCSADVFGKTHFLSCESKLVFECLYRLSQTIQENGHEDGEGSSEHKSLLLNWARKCGVDGTFENVFAQDMFFNIENDEIKFLPSPLFSLLIYEGAWNSYEDALVADVASATLPQVIPCERADGLCLRSPVPLSRCRECQSLKKGTIYTIFFLESLRQDYRDVRSLIYIPK